MLIFCFIAVAYLCAGFGFWLSFVTFGCPNLRAEGSQVGVSDHLFVLFLWWVCALLTLSEDEELGPHD